MNTSKLWRRFEIERLAAFLKEGRTIPEIAATLGRSPGATDSQARKLHLIGTKRPQKGAAYHAARLQGAARGRESHEAAPMPQDALGASAGRQAGHWPKYVAGLLAFNRLRLVQAVAAAGAWAGMAEVDRLAEVAQIAGAIERLEGQVR